MKKNICIFITVIFVGFFSLEFKNIYEGAAYSQYVANTLQQRIDDDNKAIARDQQDITDRNADIQSIVNDQTANQVTSQVPDIQNIEAAQQINAISAQPDILSP